MLTSNTTTFSVSFPLVPACPVLQDMLGSTIQYCNAKPYQRTPLLAIGLVIGFCQHRGELFLKVENTTTCRQRWISESDFICYANP